MEPLGRRPHRVEVRHRLAHPHEHDVADATIELAGTLRRPYDLFDDLSDGEVSSEACLAGRAEPARHRAPCLAAHAHRRPVGVEHQHGLDPAPAVELPQELDRVATVAHRLGDGGERGREFGVETRPQRLGQVRDVGRVGELRVEPIPQLIEAVAGLAVENARQLVAGEVVARDHVDCPDRSRRCGERFVVVDPGAHHVEARRPERLVGDVEAERRAQLLGRVHAGT